MADHGELLAEMTTVGRLSATERLKHAQKRRAQQLKGWAQMEKENARAGKAAQRAEREKKARKEGGKKVTFPSNITLLEAAARNDLEEVRQFVNSGVSPDLFNEDGLTALHQCCIDDFVDIVSCLLEAGASVNACDSEQWTPLHAAATCGHTGLVQILVQSGADLLAVNADGNMPYDLCEDEATLELLEVMMSEQGITQERIDECRGAREREMLAHVQALLESGADLNEPDRQGATLMHVAAANGYLTVGELLLEHNVSIEEKDDDGWTPLHAASCWAQIHMVELLVANGANLNARSDLDETPLDVCVDEEVRAKIMELKHKHEAIMKSQERHKGTLQRRASSASSRGKVVRRTSVNERSSLYRREHHKEAMVWQARGRQAEQPDDDEDRQTDAELKQHAAATAAAGSIGTSSAVQQPDNGTENSVHSPAVGNGGGPSFSTYHSTPSGSVVGESWRGGGVGGCMEHSGSYQLAPSGEAEGTDSASREKSHHTLAELKRQRAAAKLHKHPAPAPPLLTAPLRTSGAGGSTGMGVSSVQEVTTPNAVYFIPASGDPPLLKLRAPEEETPNTKEPCCGLM